MHPTTNPSKNDFDLDALVADQDRPFLLPIEFAYDYMPKVLPYLTASPIHFQSPRPEAVNQTRGHGIPLNPSLAKLPWYSGLTSLRQNKYWEINLRSTNELLHLFAEDATIGDTQNANGLALADFAQRELETQSFDRYSRFTTYMFPDADESRTALLAQVILFIVLFDDTWEETAPEFIKRVQEDFRGRIQGRVPFAMSDTPLQNRVSEMRRGLLEQDAIAGNGGADIVAALLDFCRHSPPATDFASVREYLDYRYEDVAMPFSYACAKFSIRSDVDLQDPKWHRYLHLVGDHFSIANDIASYDKEYNNFKNGRGKHLINVVAVVQKLFGLPDLDSAKAASYALQLWTEQAILEELEGMKMKDELTVAQWKFVEVVLAMAAGNVFTSVVISRYGGEAARIV